MSFYKDKKVLVAGGTGLIGKPLVDMLIEEGSKVRVASLDDKSRAHIESEFHRVDLTNYDNCTAICKGIDYVFNLLCMKGSPKVMKEKPATYFEGNLIPNINLLRAAKQEEVERYLYTSTVGVYDGEAEISHEDDVWKTFPSKRDWSAGWAKRMCELQAQAYDIEYGWEGVSIVRPANTYGPYDKFDSEAATAVPALIKRAVDGKNPFIAWGDGSPVRDFIYSKDVAKGMMFVLEKNPGPNSPINLGSGTRRTIKELVDIIISNVEKKPEIIWDTSKPEGDKIRVLNVKRAASLGFRSEISLEEGIKETIDWYIGNK